jgi:hypothetical protein
MGRQARHRRCSDTPSQPARRCWIVVGLLICSLIPTPSAWAGERQRGSNRAGPPQDPCQPLLQQSAKQLRHILEVRLTRGLPVTAQLDEGNAWLSPLSIRSVDCEQRHVVVSGSYEFRGNLGVMDITRRGTTVLQFRLSSKSDQRQVWLEAPEVLDVTFDNPAPWFDGKAISNWMLSLFANPVCASLQDGQPC